MADSSVHAELQRVKDRFTNSEFKTKRQLWDQVFSRDLPTELPPELTGSQEGLDYQTPDVSKTVFDHVDVLVMNPTVYDLTTLDEGATAKATGREILLWTARGWEYENEGRWWDRTVAEGQVRHGLKVMGLRWRPSIEPEAKAVSADEDENAAIERITKSASEDTEADKKLRKRNESFKKRRHPFYWIDCDLYGCYWLGDERGEYGPDLFFYQYEVPYAEAKEQFSDKKDFKLDSLGKVAWVGEEDSADEGGEWAGEKVYVTVRDGRKLGGEKCPLPGCDHPQRSIAVYVSQSSDEFLEDNKVDEVDSPFPGCSYFIIGGRTTSSRDPHERFYPLIHPLYVEAVWQNYLNTLLATAIRQDYADEDLYIDISKIPEWVQMPEGGVLSSVEKPEPGSGQLPMYPGPVVRYPKSISPHLVTMLEESAKRMNEYKMNRFLSGTAYTEASNATASAFKTQYQQAAQPFNGLLSQSDKAQIRSRRYEYHAIRFWAQAESEKVRSRFYAVMTGSQKNVKTMRASKPGEVVWLDADKLESVDFDLRVLTESETLAEQEQRWFLAKDQFVSGVGTAEDLVRSAGYEDVEGQLEKLRASYIQEDIDPLIREATKQMLIQKFSVATGFDLGALIGQPVFQSALPDGSMQPMPEEPGGGGEMTQGRNPVINSRNALNTPGNNGMNPSLPQGITGGASPMR
jgi:hypothetical protein